MIVQNSFVFESPCARKTDPGTSYAAALDANLNASPGRLKALKLLADGPKTDFELARITGLQQTSIGKRRGECMKAGLVKPLILDNQTVTRPAPSGSQATVWCITDLGRAFLKGKI